ncbi:MAG: restriction endonuclease [Leptospiraceae bacterium]|nr:restriction endonuclease [Leptospiraceae bacterium]
MFSFIVVGLIVAAIAISGWWMFFYESKSLVTQKALALASMGKYLDAKAVVRDQLDLSPDDTALLFTMSRIYGMEGDFTNEAIFLEKIISNDKYSKEITQIQIVNRLANLYYQKDQFEESFFYYLDLLDIDPKNNEALIRLGFMCIGQREFDLAEKFFKQVNEDQVKFGAYFVGRGVVASILERGTELEFFQKAINLDPRSVVAKFLYALCLFRSRKYKEALDNANDLVDLMHDDLLKYTLFQFIMVQYLSLSDYSSAMMNARLCVEIARRNEWKNENSESNLYYATCCIARGSIEEASESLIEAEYEKPHDPEIINLANYKFDLEEGTATPGNVSSRGFSFKSFLSDIPERLFPSERVYDLSGLKMSQHINVRGIVNPEGIKTIQKLSMLQPDRLAKFISQKGSTFKNTCQRIMLEMNYKAKREIAGIESEGVNYVGTSKQDETSSAVFRFRRWRNSMVSDVFLNDFLNSVSENNAHKGFLIGDCELTTGAQKMLKLYESKLVIIRHKELESLLEKVFK